MQTLTRRGFSFEIPAPHSYKQEFDPAISWRQGRAVHLPEICAAEVGGHQSELDASGQLFLAMLEEENCDELLASPPYSERLAPLFDSLGSAFNEGDDQEIETVLFDAVEQDHVLAEDLWMKVSWLSFVDDDPSMRFRFSFGIDHAEDVAADRTRQNYAAKLCDAVFPESRVITENSQLLTRLKRVVESDDIHFVERIIYFNAPNGGAYLHHDLERGHAGVVYAQLSGRTFWLALPKHALLTEIIDYCRRESWPASVTPEMQTELTDLCGNPDRLAAELNSFANNTLIHLINETSEFLQHLAAKGWSYQLEPGDVLLLPQENEAQCCWHTVFCLGEEAGQALSFAIRTDPV